MSERTPESGERTRETTNEDDGGDHHRQQGQPREAPLSGPGSAGEHLPAATAKPPDQHEQTDDRRSSEEPEAELPAGAVSRHWLPRARESDRCQGGAPAPHKQKHGLCTAVDAGEKPYGCPDEPGEAVGEEHECHGRMPADPRAELGGDGHEYLRDRAKRRRWRRRVSERVPTQRYLASLGGARAFERGSPELGMDEGDAKIVSTFAPNQPSSWTIHPVILGR